MMTCCPTGVSWLLVASYAVLLGVGGVGIWVSANNFWEEEPLPPTPPQAPEVTTTTTTTIPNPYQYHSRNDKKLAPDTYKEYVYASRYFSRATSDARLYVVLPCATSVVVAALVLVAGLHSRQFFSSTFSLYSTLCLWILTLTWIIVYQNVIAWNSRMNLDSVCWIVGFQTGIMLLLSAQIVLCMWELRRSRSGWPIINLRSLFTAEALFVTARLTLTVYTILSLVHSQVIRGFSVNRENQYDYFYNTPGIRYPLVLTLTCLSAACYSAVATLETTLSMLLGKLHTCMTGISTLLSALCCVTVAVITSPVIVKMLIQPGYIDPDTMYLSIGLSVVTFLHVIACVGFSSASRSPPRIVNTILNSVGPTLHSLGSLRISEQFWHRELPEKTERINFIFNLTSSIFTVFSIIIIVAAWDSPLYRAWGSVLVLCVNSAILVRTLPPVVMQLKFKQPENTPMNQKLMSLILETVPLLVGAIAMCAELYYGLEIFAGVINILFSAFQVFIIIHLLKSKIAVIKLNENERLTDNEEVASQDNTDEQTPHDLLA
ncbi:uncharacterized protein LOC123519976 [Portunus trituberculatus]|uniref:uncharacterized protein LOC123519976 n=1 Tax=Portunus trituberculatus TaxID=210409 RepID=UPI001E1CFB68|nr:uncharacterized protein LOC123519976 [Portunus trituberculatus]